MQTSCKTWGCTVCRKKCLALARMKMVYGCLKVGDYWLITATLKLGSRWAVNAASVRMVWERWLQLLKLTFPNLKWWRVIELTKKGTPHIHVVMGGLDRSRPDSCYDEMDETPYSEAFVRSPCKVDCLMHELARSWLDVTGDSFVVDAREGYSPGRLANYLGKYLIKGFYHRREMEERGWVRRYSSSRNWPRVGLLQTETQANGGWERVVMHPGYYRRSEMLERVAYDHDSALLKRTGDDLALALQEKGSLKGYERRLSKMIGEAYA